MTNSAHIRAIRVGVSAGGAQFGREIKLTKGLNVIRGSNNRGKTQIVQAVIYGLGLERMLNARANAPLGSVFTTELIERDRSDTPLAVDSSWVEIEIENSRGEAFSARRYIVDPVRKPDVLSVLHMPKNPSSPRRTEDMFVHRPGGASRPSGFHSFLESFVDWELPSVANFAGSETKLYVDTLFPFMIVDQQAWGSVAPRKLNRYQIKDLSRKSVEYLLALRGPVTETEKNRLEARLSEVSTQWTSSVRALQTVASVSGGRLVGLPALPAGAHAGGKDLTPSNAHAGDIELLEIDEWVGLAKYRNIRESELVSLVTKLSKTTPAPANRDAYTEVRIEQTQAAMEDVLVSLRLIEQDLGLSEARLDSLDSRLGSLEDERLRNSDLRTLERLGAEVSADHLAHHSCPTCQQSLDGVESERPETVLGIEDTVALLNAQLVTTKKMKERSVTVASQLADAEAGLLRRLDALRLELRSLRADQRAPRNISEGDLSRKISTEIRIAELDRLQTTFDTSIEELTDLAAEAANLRKSISGLDLSDNQADQKILSELSTRVQSLLAKWGFGSYAESRIDLDADELVPARDGFDLNVDVSASDVVRIKVAYLEAVREIGQVKGNHPGLLILDEPRQQDLDYEDFATILQTLSRESALSGQVITTTSTSAEELSVMLLDCSVNMVDIGDQRLLQRN